MEYRRLPRQHSEIIDYSFILRSHFLSTPASAAASRPASHIRSPRPTQLLTAPPHSFETSIAKFTIVASIHSRARLGECDHQRTAFAPASSFATWRSTSPPPPTSRISTSRRIQTARTSHEQNHLFFPENGPSSYRTYVDSTSQPIRSEFGVDIEKIIHFDILALPFTPIALFLWSVHVYICLYDPYLLAH